MRTHFVEALVRIATADPRVLLLTGDLGYMALEPFRDRFPARFLNMGVAEQNLISVATSLAEAGFLPFAYSIAPFASLRPFEFIRNGPVHHQLPVRIVGMGMGLDYGLAGPTHYGTEDIAALRTLPGLRIVIPADAEQVARALETTWMLPGPTYYSLSKDDRLRLPGLDGRFELGRLQVIRRGRDLAIVAMGSIAVEAEAAATELAARGVDATVAVVSSFQPEPTADVLELLSAFSNVVSVEAQAISGGLASFLATAIAESGLRCRLGPKAVRSRHDGSCGSTADRWRKYGLDRHSIAATALQAHAGARP
jgi:transketolase